MPTVSVIVPTHNSAETIDETLGCIAEQTCADWEAIVFDDGSQDTTADKVKAWCVRDSRFRFFSGDNRGASAARNRGVRHAGSPWLLFLDSDDLIRRDHLQKMLDAAGADPSADLVHAGGARLTPAGKLGNPEMPPRGDYFEYCGSRNPFYTHACIIKREVFNEFGGFDESLVTCEDWDLWQRLARSGRKFTAVDDCLAFYRMRRGSLTRNPRNVFDAARVVILRGHGPDPRVREPLAEYADGLPPEQAGNAVLGLALWAAAVVIGEGRDPVPFLRSAELLPVTEPDIGIAVSMIQGGVPTGACKLQGDWPRLWSKHRRTIASAFSVVEMRTKSSGFAARCLHELELRLSGSGDWPEENSLGAILPDPVSPFADPQTAGDGQKAYHFIRNIKMPDVASVMVIAAHPDDELIGAGGHMKYWPLLSVVHVTNGSPRNSKYAKSLGFSDAAALASARRREVERAFALIDIAPDRLIELGFDDQEASFHISDIARRLCEIFSLHKPDVVVTHAYEGGHPDHDATCCAVHAARRIAAREGLHIPALVEMSSYFGRDGIRVTSSFCTSHPPTTVLVLDEPGRQLKQQMLDCHISQQGIIRLFPIGVESFRPAPEYDFARPPQSGRPFYEYYDLGTDGVRWREKASNAWLNLGLD